MNALVDSHEVGLPPARVVVDLDAIAFNAEQLRRHASGASLLGIVKGDAYGHGLVPAGRAAREGGATWLGTAKLNEAFALRDAGVPGRLLAWLHAPGADFAGAIERNIDVGVSTEQTLHEVVEAGKRTGQPARVHLKVDTGMARNGAYGPAWPRLVEAAQTAQHRGEVDVVGLFSHLVASDEPDNPGNAEQLKSFAQAEADCLNARLELEEVHLANSAGVLFLPETHRTLVRPGLALYGLNPAASTRDLPDGIELRPAMSVTADVVVAKRLAQGQGVSYNHTWKAPHETTVADIPIGYADGVPRHASSLGPVLLNGRRTHVVGRVCMDQFVVDMGDDVVAPGDEAVLFGRGRDGAVGPSAQDWAEAAGTISWEIVTRMSTRLPRIYTGTLAQEWQL